MYRYTDTPNIGFSSGVLYETPLGVLLDNDQTIYKTINFKTPTKSKKLLTTTTITGHSSCTKLQLVSLATHPVPDYN